MLYTWINDYNITFYCDSTIGGTFSANISAIAGCVDAQILID
jgi:hypothetical protein